MRVHDMLKWETRNSLANKLDGERKYDVTGRICFNLIRARAYPAAYRAMIENVDRDFPWRDDVHPDWHRDFKSIKDLSDGEVVTDNLPGDPTRVWFEIRPYCKMRKSQVYAYEKYMEKLAIELAKMKFEGLESVGYGVEVITMSQIEVVK